MTEPSRPRPVPGPPRPAPAGLPATGGEVAGSAATGAVRPAVPEDPAGAAPAGAGDGAPSPYAGLDQRPVAEHVAVFEAEHDRLQRELATIDQL